MIGQLQLRDIFEISIDENMFPRFCILTGPAGCGKKTMCDWLITKFKQKDGNSANYTLPDVKIDTIREMIATSYKAADKIIYIIADADGMSTAAKNSLLKITEEPPKNAYFIMTLEDISNTLDTIKSRAAVYQMDNYTRENIDEYARRSHKPAESDFEIIHAICDVPGDVDLLYAYKPSEFYNYVIQVVDNINEVEGANAFKIADKLALKQDSTGYDVKLFLRAFMAICVSRMQTEPLKYASGTSITSKYISQLGIKGISKQMLIDGWLLEIRKYWMR